MASSPSPNSNRRPADWRESRPSASTAKADAALLAASKEALQPEDAFSRAGLAPTSDRHNPKRKYRGANLMGYLPSVKELNNPQYRFCNFIGSGSSESPEDRRKRIPMKIAVKSLRRWTREREKGGARRPRLEGWWGGKILVSVLPGG